MHDFKGLEGIPIFLMTLDFWDCMRERENEKRRYTNLQGIQSFSLIEKISIEMKMICLFGFRVQYYGDFPNDIFGLE